jgi:hypothetical protein
MAENISGMAVSKPVVDVALSEDQADAERRRLVRIKRAIRRKTSGGILELAVEVQGEALVLRGRCTSFYYKQVAQEACMSQLAGQQLVNDIQVEVRPR